MKNLIDKTSKDKIDSICMEYEIENYTINLDGSIDVYDDVVLQFKEMDKLPLVFNKVTGNFDCWKCKLTSLEGAPVSVGGHVDLRGNFLRNLIGGPVTVGMNFYCNKNKLESLEGAPSIIGKSFFFQDNPIKSTYSGDTDIEANFISSVGVGTYSNAFPKMFRNNLKHIKLILRYQRHFFIWNDDLSLNEENFQVLIEEINDGLE
jgi:hypothetical protein